MCGWAVGSQGKGGGIYQVDIPCGCDGIGPLGSQDGGKAYINLIFVAVAAWFGQCGGTQGGGQRACIDLIFAVFAVQLGRWGHGGRAEGIYQLDIRCGCGALGPLGSRGRVEGGGIYRLDIRCGGCVVGSLGHRERRGSVYPVDIRCGCGVIGPVGSQEGGRLISI